MVSGNYFRALGTGAAAGRVLVPEDDDESARQPVAVLSHALWKARFGSDPRVIGAELRVNGTACTIAGVAAEGFRGLDAARQPDLFVPLWMQPEVLVRPSRLADRTNWWVRVMARLQPGIGDEQARQELDAILRAEVAESAVRTAYEMPEVRLPPGGRGLAGLRKTVGRPLGMLLGIVAVVLLIACTNLAGLMLARGAARMGEMGTRLALGAARARLIRQMLTESLLLAAIGGAAGIGIAAALRGTLPALLVRGSDAPALDLSMDWRLLAFCAAVCTVAGLLAGVLPALRATRVDPARMLQLSGARGAANPRLRAGKALVAAQVALSTVLLVGAVLFARTLWNLHSVKLGVEAERVLTFQVNTRQVGYDPAGTRDFLEQAVARLSALAGVTSASVCDCAILGDCMSARDVRLPGAEGEPQDGISIHTNRVAPGYFRTMGIALLAGRDFTWHDRDGRPQVVLLNRTAARRLFGERNPLGRRVEDSEVIGVVADAKYDRLREDPPPTMYLPMAQNRSASGGAFVVRSAGDPGSLGDSMRRAIASMDPNLPVFNVLTQLEWRNRAMTQERLFATLLAGFSGLAILLAGIGIYGTLAYAVARRRGEIGIRMALGAGRGGVQRLVLRESLAAVLAGLAVGLGAAAALCRVVESMLYGVRPYDPLAFAAAAALLLAVAAVAAWLPAWRASGIDPMSALRA